MSLLTKDQIDDHIIRTTSALQSRPDISETEFKSIIIDLGTSETEWKWLMEEAVHRETEAGNHIQTRNYHDAWETATVAAGINPFSARALGLKAKAGLMLFLAGDEKVLEKSLQAAKAALKLDPHNAYAGEVMSALRNKSVQNQTEKSAKTRIVFAVAIALLIMGVTISLAFFFTGQADKDSPESVEKQNTNGLIEKEEAVNAAWAQVVNVLRRRSEILPQIALIIKDDPEILTELEDITNEYEQALNSAEQASAYNRAITRILQKVTPQLQSLTDEAATHLMVQLEGANNRISVEKEKYNTAVREYNTALRKLGADAPSEFKPKSYQE
jgi:LemA protein